MRCSRYAACGLIEVLPGQTDYNISRSEMTPLPLNLSHMPRDTKDLGGLGMFATYKTERHAINRI